MPILKSARTTLVPITVDDAEFLHELIQTEGWKQNIYDYQFSNVEQTIELIRNRFIVNFEQYGYCYYVVKNIDGQKVGVAGFLKKDHLENPDLGFAFMPEFYRQGFGLEVSQRLLEFAENELRLKAIDAEVKQENTASQKLLEKLGFKKILDTKVGEKGSTILYRVTF